MFDLFFIIAVDAILITISLFQIYTKGTLYRQFKGGSYVKIWWNKQHQGGFYSWENDISKDWESVNGKVVDKQINTPVSITWWMMVGVPLVICHMKAFQIF